MNDAELYTKNNALQKRDTMECLEEFAMKIRWKQRGARIIDIGCGDGSTTTEILKLFIPENFGLLIGGDISERMVSYANDNYRSDQVMFMGLNIEGRLPDELRERFDHAFSFYTLHWIKKQKLAFTNIYNLLAEGGSCLLLFVGHMPIYSVLRVLAGYGKWSAYLRDLDKFISPYHDSQYPEEELKTLMMRIGFRNVDVRCQDKSFTYNNLENLRRAVKAVTPFNIPEDRWQEYLDDYVEVLRDMRMMDVTNNNAKESITVKFSYKLLVAIANK